MYETPKSELNKYESQGGVCPKCREPITLWDYNKPAARKATTVKCKKCSSIITFDLNWFEKIFFGGTGLFISIAPAYFFWPIDEMLPFVMIYIPLVIVVTILISVVEGIYVRRYKSAQLLQDVD